MNYLEICQAVRSRIGLHGTGPSTVVSPTDVEKDIVDAVHDAWVDIQNYRDEWDWMRVTTTFNTVAQKTNYTTVDIAGPSNRVSHFIKDSLYAYKNSKYELLTYLDENLFEYRHINDDDDTAPSEYTINRNDQSIEINSPDAVYPMQVDYYKTPQLLTDNTDTPEMPVRWHLLIVYLAIQKLSSSIASASSGQEFAQAYAVMLGQLMRSQLKKKRVTMRSIA